MVGPEVHGRLTRVHTQSALRERAGEDTRDESAETDAQHVAPPRRERPAVREDEREDDQSESSSHGRQRVADECEERIRW